jgi:preprotein translocase subunit SecY
MRQVETHLIQRHYDGFLRKGRIRGGGFQRSPTGRGEAVQQGVLVWACVAAAVLLVVGLSLFLATHLR